MLAELDEGGHDQVMCSGVRFVGCLLAVKVAADQHPVAATAALQPFVAALCERRRRAAPVPALPAPHAIDTPLCPKSWILSVPSHDVVQ